ncbi:transposase [Lachnospiraceae bacterium]|nr:transposase [Lachnospiraceae bacterium]
MKNHYLLTQISDILMQLYLAWNPYIKELKRTIKNTFSWLLESFRRLTVTDEDVSYIFKYTTVYLE